MIRKSCIVVAAALAVVLSASMGMRAYAQDAPKPATSEPAKMGKPETPAQEKAEEKAEAAHSPKKAMGNWFMITTTHTSEECAKMMDDAAAKNVGWLSHSYCGCMHGDHTCWSIVQAATSDAATNMLPAEMRASAKVQQVDKFTPAMIKAAHKM
jgi:hypothetical protein